MPYFRFELNIGSDFISNLAVLNGSAYGQYVKSFFPQTNFYAGIGYKGTYASFKFQGGSSTDINVGLSAQLGFEYRFNQWSLTADVKPYLGAFNDQLISYSAGISLRYHLNYHD